MNRWFIIMACLAMFVVGCKKSEDVATNINAQAAKDDQILRDYVTANKLTTAVHVGTPRVDSIGVWYIVEDPGTTPALYTSSTTITIDYTAKVLGAAAPFTTVDGDIHPGYVLGTVIKAWQLAIQAAKINKGGKIRILSASRYAYGPYDQPQYGQDADKNYKLPKNSVLDFEITIYDVTN